jgi:hypothetical protein
MWVHTVHEEAVSLQFEERVDVDLLNLGSDRKSKLISKS